MHLLITRVCVLEPPSDLLRRPPQQQLGFNHLTQTGVVSKFARLRPTCPPPRIPICTMRPIPAPAAVASQLPRHRRRRPAKGEPHQTPTQRPLPRPLLRQVHEDQRTDRPAESAARVSQTDTTNKPTAGLSRHQAVIAGTQTATHRRRSHRATPGEKTQRCRLCDPHRSRSVSETHHTVRVRSRSRWPD